MSHEDYEVEQDRYLRTLGAKSQSAEDELRDALLALLKCHQERRQLVVTAILAVLTSFILATALAFFIYGH
jgi:hypothetical protein